MDDLHILILLVLSEYQTIKKLNYKSFYNLLPKPRTYLNNFLGGGGDFAKNATYKYRKPLCHEEGR